MDFQGQKIFIGIDVHKKSWSVSVVGEHNSFKTFTQPPSAKNLFKYLDRNFPDTTPILPRYYPDTTASFKLVVIVG